MSPKTLSAKPLLRALHGDTVSPPPLWLMRQAGRYLPEYRRVRERAGGFLDLCYTPELAAEVTLQPVRRFATDAAILFSDILVVAHALGVEVGFHEGHGPRLAPVDSAKSVDALRLDRIAEHLAPVYETVERVKEGLPATVALIGFAGAPWTLATYMVEGGASKDFAIVKLWAMRDPDGFQRLIDIVTEATVEYLVGQARHGAEVLQIFDSWAGALPESGFERWCVEPTRRIVAELHGACPGVPVIGFARGVGVSVRRYAEATGIDAVSIDSSVPARWAARELQPRVAVQGNLDPISLLAGGTAMEAEIVAIVEALGRGPFVFNLGHGIVPETPPDNVSLLVETVRSCVGGGSG